MINRIRAYRKWVVRALRTRERGTARARLIAGLAIFLLSFVARVLHGQDLAPVMHTLDQPFGGLTESYDALAREIVNGRGVLGPYDIDPSDTRFLGRAPGYSIYLATLYQLFSRDFFTVQLVQNVIDSFSPVLVFLLAIRLTGWRAGLMAGFIAAVSHHFAHISNFVLPDSLVALPVLGAMYLLTGERVRRSSRSWIVWCAAGALIGVSAWLRPQTMLLGLFAAAMLLFISRDRRAVLARGAVLAACSLLVIAPITIKNYVVHRELVPVSIGIGLNLWEGLAEASGDRFGAVRMDHEVAAQEAVLYDDPRYAGSWYTPDGIKRDRDRVRKSLRVILDHPVWYAGVMLDRMGDMLKYSAHAPLVFRRGHAVPSEPPAPIRRGWESFEWNPRGAKPGDLAGWARPPLRAVQRITKETMQLFILIGLILFVPVSSRAGFLLIVPIYYLLFQSFMHTEFRYTLPMHYFLFCFAGVTWALLAHALGSAVHRVRGLQSRRA